MNNDTDMMGDRRSFPVTNWNLVQASNHAQALESLISIYWKPLYFFVRQKGIDNESAKDIVQEFLATLIERGTFSKADPSRGRFRTFLLAALTNFMKDEAKGAGRQKRDPGVPMFSFDFVTGERDFSQQVPSGETPEMALNRAWARTLWDQSLGQIEGEAAHLQALRMYLDNKPYEEICAKTGLNESAAKVAIHRLKGRLRDIVVAHIRETVTNPADLEAEVAEFLALIS